jgi:hypothetical protein
VHSHEIRRHLMAANKPLCFERVGCCKTDSAVIVQHPFGAQVGWLIGPDSGPG